MVTFDLPPHLRAILDRRSGKPVPPGESARNRVPPLPMHTPDCRVLAQASRPRARVLTGGVPLLAATTAPAEAHNALSLVRIVLDAAFAGGAHLAYTDGAFRYFARTHWIFLSEAELGGVILRHLPRKTNGGGQHPRAKTREVVDLLKMHRATGPDRFRLAEPLPIVNVANGELWAGLDGSVELRPHDLASDLRYCLDVCYEPTATCPLYDSALDGIFSASVDPAGLINFWHEFTGYTLQPSRPDARIFVGRGKGNDGKTALAGQLVRMIGPGQVAAMPVGKLASNPFMIGHLADKLLLLDDDVAVGTVLPDGLLKTISEDKVVTGEPKHRDPFEFRIRAVPLLLCNEVPRLLDTSHGFRRRLVVIPFDRSFSDAEADRTLFPRIWATERSGVLNRALEGLRRVVQRGWKFDPPEEVMKATEGWWAEATGASTGKAEPARRPLEVVKRLRPTTALTPSARKGQHHARKAQTETADPGHSFDINVGLPAAGKGCTVQVQVGATSVEVRVTNAPVKQAPPLPAPAR